MSIFHLDLYYIYSKQLNLRRMNAFSVLLLLGATSLLSGCTALQCYKCMTVQLHVNGTDNEDHTIPGYEDFPSCSEMTNITCEGDEENVNYQCWTQTIEVYYGGSDTLRREEHNCQATTTIDNCAIMEDKEAAKGNGVECSYSACNEDLCNGGEGLVVSAVLLIPTILLSIRYL